MSDVTNFECIITPHFTPEPDPLEATMNIIANMSEFLGSGEATWEDLREIEDFTAIVAAILDADR
jgi:hypothetical protein